MAWQNPKTNWAAADGVRESDMNRIEGNIQELHAMAFPTADRYIYVRLSGNDTTGDGTSSKPLRTIAKALSVITSTLRGSVAEINVEGGSYDEDVLVAGFSGLVRINITTSPLRLRTLVVRNASLMHTGQQLNVMNAGTNATAITVSYGGVFRSSGPLYIANCSYGVDTNTGGVFNVQGTVTFATIASTAVDASSGSRIYIASIGGASSATAISASIGGMVAYGSAAISAPVKHSTSAGGRIYSGAQTSIPNY